jgi:NitT/TauT family transport system ATP-binding protein
VTVANHAELISFKGFGKTFVTKAGDLRAATDIDLAIRQGEFVTLVGPSGCGKSTLLNAAVGLFPPTSGQVLYRGEPVSGDNNCMERATKGSIEMPRQQS